MGEKQSKTVSEAEIQHIQQALALVRKEDKEALREIFRQFAATAKKSKKYKVNKPYFFQCLHISGPLGDRLFDALDTSKKKALGYVEFVRGLGILLKASVQDKSQLLFGLADTRRSRALTRQEFRTLLMHLAQCLNSSVTFLLTGAGDGQDPPQVDDQTMEQAWQQCNVNRGSEVNCEQWVQFVMGCPPLKWFIEMEFLIRHAVDPADASRLVIDLFYDKVNEIVVPELPMDQQRMEQTLAALARECIDQFLQISVQDQQYFPDLQNRLTAVQQQVLNVNRNYRDAGRGMGGGRAPDAEMERQQFRTQLQEKQAQTRLATNITDQMAEKKPDAASMSDALKSRMVFASQRVASTKATPVLGATQQPIVKSPIKQRPVPPPVQVPTPSASSSATSASSSSQPAPLSGIAEESVRSGTSFMSGRTTPSVSKMSNLASGSSNVSSPTNTKTVSAQAAALAGIGVTATVPSPKRVASSPRSTPAQSPISRRAPTPAHAATAIADLESRLADERKKCELLQKRLMDREGQFESVRKEKEEEIAAVRTLHSEEIDQVKKEAQAELAEARSTIEQLKASKEGAEKELQQALAKLKALAEQPLPQSSSSSSASDIEDQLKKRLEIARAQWELETQEKVRVAVEEARKSARQIELDLQAQVSMLQTEVREQQEEAEEQRQLHEDELKELNSKIIDLNSKIISQRFVESPSRKIQQKEKEWESQRAKISSEYESEMAAMRLKLESELAEQKNKQKEELEQAEKQLREEYDKKIEEQVMAHNKRLIAKHKQVRDEERKRYEKRLQEIEEEWVRRTEEMKKAQQGL